MVGATVGGMAIDGRRSGDGSRGLRLRSAGAFTGSRIRKCVLSASDEGLVASPGWRSRRAALGRSRHAGVARQRINVARSVRHMPTPFPKEFRHDVIPVIRRVIKLARWWTPSPRAAGLHRRDRRPRSTGENRESCAKPPGSSKKMRFLRPAMVMAYFAPDGLTKGSPAGPVARADNVAVGRPAGCWASSSRRSTPGRQLLLTGRLATARRITMQSDWMAGLRDHPGGSTLAVREDQPAPSELALRAVSCCDVVRSAGLEPATF